MLSRRDILKAMLLSSAAGLAGCGSTNDNGTQGASTASVSIPRNNVDVAIIGSGVAGLVAAQTLKAAGRSFVVLEARNRPGGRTFSDNSTFGSQPVDLGAQFFHQSEVNPLLLDAIAQNKQLIPDTGAREFFANGAKASDADVAATLATAAAVSHALDDAGSGARLGLAPDVSCFQAVQSLTNQPFFELVVAGLVNGRTGFKIEDPTSVEDFANFTDTSPLVLAGLGDDIYIPSGMGNFVLATYAAGIPISLNSPVTNVAWGNAGGVQLTTPQGTLTARTVIVAIPPTMVVAGKPSFTPALPADYMTAFSTTVLGTVDKVILEFSRDPFGLPAGTFATPMVNSQEIAPTVINMFGANLTLSFVDGDLAKQLEAEGPAAAVDFVLTELSGMFGSSVRAAYSGRNLVTSWGTDPWTMGSYSSVLPGHASNRTLLQTPVANQVFFAGEHVSVGSHGSINAAYVAGQLAASKIIAALSGAKPS